jgi:hypothetical protein
MAHPQQYIVTEALILLDTRYKHEPRKREFNGKIAQAILAMGC